MSKREVTQTTVECDQCGASHVFLGQNTVKEWKDLSISFDFYISDHEVWFCSAECARQYGGKVFHQAYVDHV